MLRLGEDYSRFRRLNELNSNTYIEAAVVGDRDSLFSETPGTDYLATCILTCPSLREVGDKSTCGDVMRTSMDMLL